ncbi:hypothetical protein ACA910_002924 [Epithemia clementina (nom. ined.)]
MFSTLNRLARPWAITLAPPRPSSIVVGTSVLLEQQRIIISWAASLQQQQQQQQPQQLCRWVHSKRQIYKRFKGFRRKVLDARLGIDRSPRPPPAVEFPPVYTPDKVLSHGWSLPPPPEFERPAYPFQILRTRNKPHGAVGFLPVYTKYRNDGTKIITRIRKVRGDQERFVQELRAVLKIPIPKNPKEDTIRIRAGTIEVKGHRVKEVRDWLIGLGF